MYTGSINYVRSGNGRPLLLIHGEGSSLHTWAMITEGLTMRRDVIAIDLPGFGASEPLKEKVTIDSLADAVSAFIIANQLNGIDVVGSSAGGCIALELARRGNYVGTTIALNPPGFWRGWQRDYYHYTMNLFMNVAQHFKGPISKLLNSMIMRKLLLMQLSSHPFKLPHEFLAGEMEQLANSASFDDLIHSMVFTDRRKGVPKTPVIQPVVIGWGRKDRLCPPSQAKRALEIHPGATVFWFNKCGHFPQWDVPDELVKLILGVTV